MEIMVRASAIYFFLWMLTRALGKRELAELTAFELILMMVVGDLIQQGVTQEDTSITGAFLAVGTIGAWILVFSWLGFRSKRARRVIDGVPVVVLRDGRPLLAALRIERVAVEELLEEARNQGIGNLRDIEVGILEADGAFSFIQRRIGDDGRPSKSPSHKGAG